MQAQAHALAQAVAVFRIDEARAARGAEERAAGTSEDAPDRDADDGRAPTPRAEAGGPPSRHYGGKAPSQASQGAATAGGASARRAA
jgi:hypothetical protein